MQIAPDRDCPNSQQLWKENAKESEENRFVIVATIPKTAVTAVNTKKAIISVLANLIADNFLARISAKKTESAPFSKIGRNAVK